MYDWELDTYWPGDALLAQRLHPRLCFHFECYAMMSTVGHLFSGPIVFRRGTLHIEFSPIALDASICIDLMLLIRYNVESGQNIGSLKFIIVNYFFTDLKNKGSHCHSYHKNLLTIIISAGRHQMPTQKCIVQCMY